MNARREVTKAMAKGYKAKEAQLPRNLKWAKIREATGVSHLLGMTGKSWRIKMLIL